jgi:SET domain-containing protein
MCDSILVLSLLQVRKSVIHGGGLFAKEVFEKNEMIVEYIGQKIRQVVADRREAQYEEEGVGSCYLFRLDKESIIDATRTGGMARFMNHSCEPNAYAKVITTTKPLGPMGVVPGEGEEEDKHIVIMAIRDILEGEEITYDYKFPLEEKKLKCYCGASRCLGSMN